MNRITGFYMSFKGKTSTEMGAFPTSLPKIQTAVVGDEMKNIAGRMGFITVRNNSYKAVKIKQEIAVPNESVKDAVLAWLSGDGELFFSTDTTKAWDACVLTAYEQTPLFSRLDGIKFTVTFDCHPFRHARNEAQIVLRTGNVFNGLGTENADPLLKLEGSGTGALIVNGHTVTVQLTSNKPLYLDCETGDAFTDDNGLLTPAGNCVVLTDSWPYLLPKAADASGYNNVSFTGGISKVTITPRWRWY